MKKIIGITAIILSMLCSCKDKGIDYKYYTAPQGLKDYFNYQTGTYWILKDSVYGNIDSFAVNDRDTFSVSSGADAFASNEIIAVHFTERHIYPNGNSYTEPWAIYLEPRDGPCFTRMEAEYRIAPNFTIGWPFAVGGITDSIERSFIPNAVVNGKSYKDIYRYKQIFSEQEAIEVWINADSGFIKINSLLNNQKMELQQSHIVR